MDVSGPAEAPRRDRGADVVLQLRGVTKTFGPVRANDEIDLVLRRGEILALLGENGAGKTTLMSILFGHYMADAGHIEVFGHMLPPGSPRAAIAAGIGMVHQHFTLADNLSVLDNVILGTEPLWRVWSGRPGARTRLDGLMRRFGLVVDPDAMAGSLSVGERQRVEILKVLYRDARILILDEPTAVLTPQETETLFATLRTLVAGGMSIIFISHKLNEVSALAHRVVVLRRGRAVAECGAAETSRTRLAELMVGRPVAPPIRTPLEPGAPVLRLSNVTLSDASGWVLLDRAELTVRRHEIVGIAGVSGNGQAALAALVSGLLVPDAGTLEILGERLGQPTAAGMVARNVARIPEDRHATGLVLDMSVWENLLAERYREPRFSRFGIQRRGAAKLFAQSIVEAFDVRCSGLETPARLLSGGNMQKLILGRTLSRNPGLILANQPTRGLDIGAVTAVHERLLAAREAGAGILLISEDLDEIMTLSDRVAVIYRGRLNEAQATSELDIASLGLRMAGQVVQDAA